VWELIGGGGGVTQESGQSAGGPGFFGGNWEIFGIRKGAIKWKMGGRPIKRMGVNWGSARVESMGK